MITGILQKAILSKKNTEKSQADEIDKIDELGGIMTDFKNYYNSTKGCNSPKLTSGLTPVNYNSSKKVWEKCSKEEWDWDYKIQTTDTANGGTSKWANAMSEDGSLWVWIPRFAYQIKSGYHQSAVGEIDVVFLVGTTNTDQSGQEYDTSYNMQEATTNGRMSKFVVHPVFGTNTDTSSTGTITTP